jgi:uncharacterized membrane protein
MSDVFSDLGLPPCSAWLSAWRPVSYPELLTDITNVVCDTGIEQGWFASDPTERWCDPGSFDAAIGGPADWTGNITCVRLLDTPVDKCEVAANCYWLAPVGGSATRVRVYEDAIIPVDEKNLVNYALGLLFYAVPGALLIAILFIACTMSCCCLEGGCNLGYKCLRCCCRKKDKTGMKGKRGGLKDGLLDDGEESDALYEDDYDEDGEEDGAVAAAVARARGSVDFLEDSDVEDELAEVSATPPLCCSYVWWYLHLGCCTMRLDNCSCRCRARIRLRDGTMHSSRARTKCANACGCYEWHLQRWLARYGWPLMMGLSSLFVFVVVLVAFSYAIVFSVRTGELEVDVESTMSQFVDFANGLIQPISQLQSDIPAAQTALLGALNVTDSVSTSAGAIAKQLAEIDAYLVGIAMPDGCNALRDCATLPDAIPGAGESGCCFFCAGSCAAIAANAADAGVAMSSSVAPVNGAIEEMKTQLLGGLSSATSTLLPVMETGGQRLTQMSVAIGGVKGKLSAVVSEYGLYIQLAIAALIIFIFLIGLVIACANPIAICCLCTFCRKCDPARAVDFERIAKTPELDGTYALGYNLCTEVMTINH